MYLKQRTAFRSHPYCHGYTSERRSGNKWGEKNNKVPSVLKSSLSEHRCPLQLSPGCRQSSLTVLCLIIRPKWKLTARTTRKQGPWHKGRDDIIEMMACSGRKASEMGTIHLEPPPWGGLTAPCCPLGPPHGTGTWSQKAAIPYCKTSCTKSAILQIYAQTQNLSQCFGP